jgi:hypothetical protein
MGSWDDEIDGWDAFLLCVHVHHVACYLCTYVRVCCTVQYLPRRHVLLLYKGSGQSLAINTQQIRLPPAPSDAEADPIGQTLRESGKPGRLGEMMPGTHGHSRIRYSQMREMPPSKSDFSINLIADQMCRRSIKIWQTKRPTVCFTASQPRCPKVSEPPPLLREHRNNNLNIRPPRFPRFVTTCCVTILPLPGRALVSNSPFHC